MFILFVAFGLFFYLEMLVINKNETQKILMHIEFNILVTISLVLWKRLEKREKKSKSENE